jgi:hypothetical protein
MAVRENMACILWSMSLLLADSIYVKYRILLMKAFPLLAINLGTSLKI